MSGEEVWIINGRCEPCVAHDCTSGCDCWCHEMCLECGRGECDEPEHWDPGR